MDCFGRMDDKRIPCAPLVIAAAAVILVAFGWSAATGNEELPMIEIVPKAGARFELRYAGRLLLSAAITVDGRKSAEDGRWRQRRDGGWDYRVPGGRWRATVDARDGDIVGVTVRGRGGAPMPFVLDVQPRVSEAALPCRLSDAGAPDTLFAASGGAAPGTAWAIYDPQADLAIAFSGGTVRFPSRRRILVDTQGGEIGILIVPDLYRKKHGLTHFTPIDRSRFPHAPAGWCSWYIYGAGVTEQNIIDNTDFIASRLRSYGCDVVQIDDGYQARRRTLVGGHQETYDWLTTNDRFPRGMKWFASHIARKGLTPGIWSVPFGINNPDQFAAHPDWFLRDDDGSAIATRWPGPYVYDPTVPAVRREHIERVYRTLVRDYGYRYLKLDGLPVTVAVYSENRSRLRDPETTGEEVVRLGLETVRKAAGRDCFLLGSWGTCPAAAGILNGCRIGGDVRAEWRGVQKALEATLGWYFTHNVMWYADPDVFCVREPLTIDQARAWASLLGLTGQMTLNSDDLPALSSERVDIIRRVMPTADIAPVDLFPRKRPVSRIALHIVRPWETWDVVGVFNWDAEQRTFRLDLPKLGMDAPDGYLVWDFWEQRFLGSADKRLTVEVAPTSCRVLGLRRHQPRPQLLSTDRHVTQGAVDVIDCRWSAAARTLRGISQVPRGEYRLFLHMPDGWNIGEVTTDPSMKPAVEMTDANVCAILLRPRRKGGVRWSVRFDRKER